MIPRWFPALRSTSFRFILIYVSLFLTSTGLLLAFAYHTTLDELERQIRNTVNIQRADLGRKFILDGPEETTAAIGHVIAKDTEQALVYALVSPRWEMLAGNLNHWPGGSDVGWLRVPADAGDPDSAEIYGTNSYLPGGYILFVGYNMDQTNRVRHIILRSFGLGAAFMLALAIASAILLSRTITRRLESVNQLCRRIMAGHLDERARTIGSHDEFDQLAGNVNAMLGRLQELIAGIRDMSANVAHDLRTPITRVRNRLERLQNETLSATIREKELQKALTDIDGLIETFNAILRISHAETGAGISAFAPFDFAESLHSVIELYAPLAEERQIDLSFTLPDHQPYHGDRHLLTQAIANLLDNALKYSPANSHVTLCLRETPDALELTIADQGPGIPEEHHLKVREKFFRLESHRSTPGNGLGLSLAHAAFTLHGAIMRFHNNAPGLRIEIRFPHAG